MYIRKKNYKWTHERKPRIFFSKLNKIRPNDRTGNNNASAPPARETFANFRLKQQLRTRERVRISHTLYYKPYTKSEHIPVASCDGYIMCVYRVLFLFDETRSRTHIHSVKASNFPHPVNVKLNYSLFPRRGCWSVVCEPRMRARIRPVLTY